MKVYIKDIEKNKETCLVGVEKIIHIHENYTQCEELKNSVLVIHKANHIEKYRLYKNARIIKVEDTD